MPSPNDSRKSGHSKSTRCTSDRRGIEARLSRCVERRLRVLSGCSTAPAGIAPKVPGHPLPGRRIGKANSAGRGQTAPRAGDLVELSAPDERSADLARIKRFEEPSVAIPRSGDGLAECLLRPHSRPWCEMQRKTASRPSCKLQDRTFTAFGSGPAEIGNRSKFRSADWKSGHKQVWLTAHSAC